MFRLAAREYDVPLLDASLMDQESYSTARADSTHFIFVPFETLGLQIVPRLGGRLTWYEQTSDATVTDAQLAQNMEADNGQSLPSSSFTTTAYDSEGSSQMRWIWEAGVEASTKFHKTWQDMELPKLNVKGMRHVLRPYVNYTYVSDPNVSRENLYFFDETDRIRENHFVRTGLEQRFQTRRDGRIQTFARADLFVDHHLNPPDQADGDNDTAEIGAVLELRPSSRVRAIGKFLANADDGDLEVADVGVEGTLDSGVRLGVAYLFRDDHRSQPAQSMATSFERIHAPQGYSSYFERSHNVRTSMMLPISARDRFNMSHYFDLEDGRLARHRYEWTRDFSCWVGSLGFEYESDDYAVLLTLYLKAFPGARVSTGL